MKVKRTIVAMTVGLVVLAFCFNAWAGDDVLEDVGRGPSFADMVADAQNVVFAQIVKVTANTVEVSISQTLKGRARDRIFVAGFKKMKFIAENDPRKLFEAGQDVFFFLNTSMVGSLPYEPKPKSVIVKVDRNKVKTSIITPTVDTFAIELDFAIFKSYLQNLVAHNEGQVVDPVFLGKLVEKLEKEAANSESKLAPTYLTMVMQLNPAYDNLNVLFNLLQSNNLDSRVLALKTLTNIATKLYKPEDAATQKPKKKAPKPKKGKKGKKVEESPYEQVFQHIVAVLKTDKSRLMQSLAAVSLSRIHDPRAVDSLEEMVDSASLDMVEACEVYPRREAEAPRKAILRAIVEFEGDRTLDILERELRKDEVQTFRLVLQIFRDYSDMNLNLLLLDLLQDRNFLPRQVAILEYFRSIRDDSTIKQLQELFLSPQVGSEFIRKSIIEVFQDMRDKSTAPFLIKHGLHDPSAVVRQAAAKALGVLGDEQAVEEFRNIYFKESNRLAREFYVEALSQIRSKAAYDTLMWLKEKETDAHMLQQIQFALKKSKYLSQ